MHKLFFKGNGQWKNKLKKWLPFLSFFSILGPGLIATAAGNDAGGIATYSLAGAHFGYQLIWLMLPLTISFVLVQEMSARLGAATGKGFSDLVRENFTLKTTVFLMLLLFIANTGIIISEFAGVAASLELFGISKFLSVPVTAVFIWWLVTKGNYYKVEKIFLLMSGILVSYIITTFLAKPDWSAVVASVTHPRFLLEGGF